MAYTLSQSGQSAHMTEIIESVIPSSADTEVIRLTAKLALMQSDMDRIITDRDSLPVGWHAVKITDNTIRINAMDYDGNYCHWILSTERDT